MIVFSAGLEYSFVKNQRDWMLNLNFFKGYMKRYNFLNIGGGKVL